MRIALAILVIAAACFANLEFSPHHTGSSVFETLYMHLMPAPLVTDNHVPHEEQELLLPVALPGFLSFMDLGWHGGADAAGHTPEGHAPQTALFNLQIFQVAAVLLVLLCFSGVPKYLRTGKGDQLTRLFAGFAMWVRDDMVYPVMGSKDGTRFLPFFLSVFFFILFMNLMGLVPGSATPTASIFVTLALATITLISMVAGGMISQGPIKFWLNLVPHVPLPLWPLLFVVEVLGLFVKPFALTIRLFANMSGGHMVVLSFMGLIFFFPTLWGTTGGWAASPLGAGFAIFIMIIEVFVAMVQAFIFTQLSVIFIHQSIHPEH